MNQVLESILLSGEVVDKDGEVHRLHSHTKKEQCQFLQDIIQEIKPSSSLEIGLAYGVSTLAILEELSKLGKPYLHTVIDPFQDSWNNIGLLNIEKAGLMENVAFHRKFSDQVLPAMYNDNCRIQFAYIDSTKVFDVLMTDVYFIDKILDVNGVLVLDDCGFPGIRTLVRYISQLPGYEIYRTFSKDGHSFKLRFIRQAYLSLLSNLPFRNRVLPAYNFKRDDQLGVNYDCIAFRKIKEDDRNWDWYKNF